MKYYQHGVQECAEAVYQGQAFETEERGRKGSCMKTSAQCWARAVNPGDGVYELWGSVVCYTLPRLWGSPWRGLREVLI